MHNRYHEESKAKKNLCSHSSLNQFTIIIIPKKKVFFVVDGKLIMNQIHFYFYNIKDIMYTM
jgi:hypothetical protein